MADEKKLCPICGKVKPQNRYKYCSAECMKKGKQLMQKKRRKENINKSFYNLHNTKGQPCWECKKYSGGCSWSRSFTPIKGWIAEQVERKESGKVIGIGYKIKYCPEFEPD